MLDGKLWSRRCSTKAILREVPALGWSPRARGGGRRPRRIFGDREERVAEEEQPWNIEEEIGAGEPPSVPECGGHRRNPDEEPQCRTDGYRSAITGEVQGRLPLMATNLWAADLGGTVAEIEPAQGNNEQKTCESQSENR